MLYHISMRYDMDDLKEYYLIDRYNKIKKAFLFAKEKHANQLRKNGSLYINHPILVANLIDKFYFLYDNVLDLKIAAYLHDTVEDTDATIEEIEKTFGSYVAYLVLGVTNDKKLIDVIGKTSYLADKLIIMENDVLDLKLCDRLANVMDLSNANESFKKRYILETITILNNLLDKRELTKTQLTVIKNINKELKDLGKQNTLKIAK